MKKSLTIFLYVLLALVLLTAGFLCMVLTMSWGQELVTKQVNKYLAQKLKTPFSIGRITYSVPDWITLENVYLATPQGDTLLSGQRLYVNLAMFELLRKRIVINELELDHAQLAISRTLPDTAFNFQFLIDAFDTGRSPQLTDTVAAPLDFKLANVVLKDVRVHYVDDVTGVDANVYLNSLRARLERTNLAKSQYYLTDVAVDGFETKTRIYPGIDTPRSATKEASSDTLDLRLGTWRINRARWDIRVEEAGFQTKGTAGHLRVATDYCYLNRQHIGLQLVELANTDLAVTLGKRREQSAKPLPVAVGKPPASKQSWFVKVDDIQLVNNHLRFDDQNIPIQHKGIDYGHLDIRNLRLVGKRLSYGPDAMAAQIQQGSFREKSGFILQKLNGTIHYSPTQTSLTDLFIQTPQTVLRDQLILRYDSVGQLGRPAEATRIRLQANLRESTVSVADILLLAPFLADTPLFADNRNAIVRVNTRMSGTLALLDIPTFEMMALSGTILRASGQLRNVTDVDRFGMNLLLKEVVARSADIRRIVPLGILPNPLRLPPEIRLTGRIRGKLDDVTIQSQVQTDWGNADFDVLLSGFMSGHEQTYKGTLALAGFDARRWLRQTGSRQTGSRQTGTIGRITANALFDGRGLDLKTMGTTFQLAVEAVELNGYRYQNLDLRGQLAKGVLDVRGRLNDPNARVWLDTKVGLFGEYPSVEGDITLERIDLQQLKLYKQPLELSGKLSLAMASTNPTNPKGTFWVRDAIVRMDGKYHPIDSLYVVADSMNGRKTLLARLPFGRVTMSGQYQYTKLYDIIISEMSRYFAVPDLKYEKVDSPYSVYIKVDVRADSLLKSFLPELTRMDSLNLDAYLDTRRDTTLSVKIRSGVITYGMAMAREGSLTMVAVDNCLKMNGKINDVWYDHRKINATAFSGAIANNQIQFRVANKDSLDQERYGLAGQLTAMNGAYRLQLNQENGLLVNYEPWSSDTSGYIEYGKDGLQCKQFVVRSNEKRLAVTSTEPRPNAPLQIEAAHINLSNLVRIANQDTALVAGELNGNILLKDYMKHPSFVGDVRIDNLNVMEKPLGTLVARFANAFDKKISVDMGLRGEYNDLDILGFYNPTSTDQALDFKVSLVQLDTRVIEAFSIGQLRQAKGRLKGQLFVTGSASSPGMNGELTFDSVAFKVAQLNTTYRIDQEMLTFRDRILTFKDFDVYDTLGRAVTTNGTVMIRTLSDVTYKLDVSAKNFQVLNAARKDNAFAYGKASVTALLQVRGGGTQPSVFGTVRLDHGSKIMAVLPDDSPAISEAKDVVTFVKPGDTLSLAKYLVRPKRGTIDTQVALEKLSKSTISLSLEADEQSEVTIIVDELNGDHLRVRGNAQLNLSANSSGQVTLAGRYEVTEGAYLMTYQVLKRQFIIQKGSSITWTGDPVQADIDITAIYRTEAVPADLVANELSGPNESLKIKRGFDVALRMSGNLLQPQLAFDILLAQGGGGSVISSKSAEVVDAIENKLKQLRQDPSQMNKQVLGLLVMNGFITENSTGFFSGSGGGRVGETALNSVSKLLSEQLERLASTVLKGVDVDFNLLSQSRYDNTGSPTGGSRPALNVGLSKSFMQGRLIVSVGRNFTLQNTTNLNRNPADVFDNVSLNYQISRDGRYMVRVYRNNNTNQAAQAVLEGYVIETGVGFSITIDYNTLADLFSKQKEVGL